MYSEILDPRAPIPQFGNAAGEDTTGGTAPAGMNQRDGVENRVDDVHRNAVGGGDRQEYSGSGGRVSVDPGQNREASKLVMPNHRRSMHLPGDDQRPTTGHSVLQCLPTGEHSSDRGTNPGKPQIEGRVPFPSSGNPGHHPVSLAPFGQLEPGHRPWHCALVHPSTRSIPAPSAISRASMFS